MKKIKIKPNEPVGLKLLPDGRQMILDSAIGLNDDLEELAGALASEANLTKDRRLEKKLDRINERITGLLEPFERKGVPPNNPVAAVT
jgi:hypothetical protein